MTNAEVKLLCATIDRAAMLILAAIMFSTCCSMCGTDIVSSSLNNINYTLAVQKP